MGQTDTLKQLTCVQLVVTQGVWGVNVKSQNNRYGVMCSVIGYKGPHVWVGKREKV